MFVDTNWTPIVQFFIGVSRLLNTHYKLLNVSETAVEQRLQLTAQPATTDALSSNAAQKYRLYVLNIKVKLPTHLKHAFYQNV